MFLTIELCFHAKLNICMKMNLVLNNLQRLIYHKIQTTNQPIKWYHLFWKITNNINFFWNTLIFVRFFNIFFLFFCLKKWRCVWILNNFLNSQVGRVFANGPGNRGSHTDWVIWKTQKMVLDTALLNTQHYKICIKGKEEQSRERSSILHYTSV